jgi:alpha-glucosidase
MPRTATRYCFGEDDRRAKVAAAMLLTLRGTPFLYYGEEIGLRDIPIRKKSDVKDPIGKTFWPFHKGRDGCRAPMQWDSTPHAGFSDETPWLPVHENYPRRNVRVQQAEPESILNFVKALIAIRKAEPALQKGTFIPLVEKPRHVMAFLRRHGEDDLMVILNFSSRQLHFDLPSGAPDGVWSSLLNEGQDVTDALLLAPYQVEILKLKS